MPLNGNVARQLNEGLGSAFSSRLEFDQLILYGLNRQLSEFADGVPVKQLHFDLIQMAEREGFTEKLIKVAYTLQRNNPELAAFVRENRPELIEETLKESSPVEAVRAFVRLLDIRDIRDKAVKFILIFEDVARRIQELSHYKALHDGLHSIQFSQIPTLERSVFDSADDMREEELERSETDLEDLALGLRTVADYPEMGPEERIWVRKISTAARLVRSARTNSQPDSLNKAIRLLEDEIVAGEFSRIYSLLSSAFRRLPLKDLTRELRDICTGPSSARAHPDELARVRQGLDRLETIQREAEALVREHGQWHQIENNLRELLRDETISTQPEPPLWAEIVPTLLALCAASNDTWATDLREVVLLASQRLQTTKESTDILQRVRRRAIKRFFHVDKTLSGLCNELRITGGPLAEVLEVLKNEPAAI